VTDPFHTSAETSRRSKAVAAFSTDIRRAISLRESFYQRELDNQFIQGGGQIFWAIDPAIINKYFGVAGLSDRDPYTDYRIFADPADPENSVHDYPGQLFDVLVGRLLSPAMVAGNQPPGLLLLPGHTTEAKRAYDSVVQTYEGSTHSKAPRAQLVAFLKQLDALPVEKRVALTERHQEDLHLILYGLLDAHQKFRTFASALAERRLVTIKGARYAPGFQSVHPVHSVLTEIADGKRKTLGDEDYGSEVWWKDRLRSMRTTYAAQDAIALSRLYELNAYLERRNCRIILLTDNNLIKDMAADIVPRRYNGERIINDTFADLYIRHPKCFLSEGDVLLPSGERGQASNMTGWLDAFLAKMNINGKGDLASFRSQAARYKRESHRDAIAGHALDRFESIHRNLSTDWYRHVRNVLLAHVSTSKEAIERYVAQLDVTERDRVEVLSEFESIVSEMTENTWSEFFLSAARSGYELISIVSDKSLGRMRNMPILYFRGLPEGEKLLKLMYSPNGVVENAAEIRATLESLNTSGDSADFYVAALCICILFAYADRWAIASALANRAVEIGDRELESLESRTLDAVRGRKIVSGREANYLACVTGRLTARSIFDLERCDRLLNQAVSALNYENDFCSSRGISFDEYPPITGLRTDAERVAVETARCFFELQAARWEPLRSAGFHKILRGNVRKAHEVIADAGHCDSLEVKRATLINLRLALFSNWLLLEIEGVLTPEDTEDTSRLVQDQIDDILAGSPIGHEKQISPVDLYSILYAASFNPPFHQSLLATHSWARECSITVEPRSPFLLMPYDRVKCRRMMELAQSRISAAGPVPSSSAVEATDASKT
jgi:hypothetical protein